METRHHRALSLLLVACLLVACLLTPAAAHAQSAREVAARVHREGGYGDRLRVGSPEGGPSITFGGGGSSASEPTSAPAPRRRSPSDAGPSLGAGLGALSYVLLGLALIAVVALVFLLITRMRPQGGELAPTRAARPRDVAPSALPGRGLVDPFADPDALAAQGRFAEAIAAALLGSLRAVGWRPEGSGKSRTAREILASVPSHDARRPTLAALVGLEERIAFGGDEASIERWQQARERWLAITREGAA